MTRALRCVAVVAAVLVLAACDGPTPISATSLRPAPPAAPPPSRFPPLSGPSRTYQFERPIGYDTPWGAMDTAIVLYDSGGFVLRYLKTGGEYRGGYTTSGPDVVFEWEGWSAAGPWGATGTLDGDTLTIRYNLVMWWTDFEDGIYVRVPETRSRPAAR